MLRWQSSKAMDTLAPHTLSCKRAMLALHKLNLTACLKVLMIPLHQTPGCELTKNQTSYHRSTLPLLCQSKVGHCSAMNQKSMTSTCHSLDLQDVSITCKRGPNPRYLPVRSTIDKHSATAAAGQAANGVSSEAEAAAGSFEFDDACHARLNEVLQQFEGTHNFHNFTVKVPASDPSAKRYIVKFSCPGTVLIEVLPWAFHGRQEALLRTAHCGQPLPCQVDPKPIFGMFKIWMPGLVLNCRVPGRGSPGCAWS